MQPVTGCTDATDRGMDSILAFFSIHFITETVDFYLVVPLSRVFLLILLPLNYPPGEVHVAV